MGRDHSPSVSSRLSLDQKAATSPSAQEVVAGDHTDGRPSSLRWHIKDDPVHASTKPVVEVAGPMIASTPIGRSSTQLPRMDAEST
jgi:hypothetical protein